MTGHRHCEKQSDEATSFLLNRGPAYGCASALRLAMTRIHTDPLTQVSYSTGRTKCQSLSASARAGTKKRPVYHVVVADSRFPRDGRFIERLGHFNPLLPKDNEARLKLDMDKVKAWLAKGAQPSDRVTRFLDAAGVVKRAAAQQSGKGRAAQGAQGAGRSRRQGVSISGAAVAAPDLRRPDRRRAWRARRRQAWTFTEDPLAVKRYGPLLTKDGARQFEVTHCPRGQGIIWWRR